MFMSWSITDRLSTVVRADYIRKTSGDENNNFYAQASLNRTIY
jgi:hypothetical protein